MDSGPYGTKVLGLLVNKSETERPLELADPATILPLERPVLDLRGTLRRTEGVECY